MECSVCGVRSSVGYCAECQALLCEECAIKCESCGKLVCPKHAQETRRGRRLCTKCYDERRARHEMRHAAAAPGGEGEPAPADAEEGVEAGDEYVLTASAKRGPEPWQWSLYIALGGAALVVLLFVVPGLRRIPLGGTAYIPTPYVLLLLPIVAVVWALVGLTREESYEDRPKCFIGIAVAVLTVVLAAVAVTTDPTRKAEQEALREQQERLNLTPEELDEWKRNQMEQYNR